MATIAQSVRDRIGLTRRIQGQSAEARFSVLGILGIVYGIALLAYTSNTERVRAFVSSEGGGWVTAACVVLQGVGLLWMARLTRIEA